MSASLISPHIQQEYISSSSIQLKIETKIDNLMTSLPRNEDLATEERRAMIGRYTAVLEGNFIYWMTAAYLSVDSNIARPIIIENLQEEVGDSHPVMLRNFAIAAGAFPTHIDALVVHEELTKVRLFLGRLWGIQTLATMAFLEGWIQKFMPYLAAVAVAQGSAELEYTTVHGVCDVAHTEGLFRALSLEMERKPLPAGVNILEGVELLELLIRRIVYGRLGTLSL